MTKVYVITEGSYSDYHILKVCASLDAASRFRRDLLIEDYKITTSNQTSKTLTRQVKKIRLDATGKYGEEYLEDQEVPNPNYIDKMVDFDTWARNHGSYREFDIEEYEVYE